MTSNKQRAVKTAFFSILLGVAFLLTLPGWKADSTYAAVALGPRAVLGVHPSALSSPLQGPTSTVTPTELYLPVIPVILPPAIELLDVWVEDSQENEQKAYRPGDAMDIRSVLFVSPLGPVTSTLTHATAGPCGAGQVFNGTLMLDPGLWEHGAPTQAQNCTGLFTITTVLSEERITPTLTTEYVVNPLSEVLVTDQAGFDKCAVTTVDKMQTWWDESPYSVANLYIGGAAFACPNQNLDAVWIHKVSQQGWTFIPTWVGPQAPCTSFNHRMSWTPATAYQEGQVEAAAAAVAAREYGFFGDQIIYYDLEAFPNASTACRAATDAFMEGWTRQLHDLGFKAGGYGQECSSYMTDWVDNSPSPDDIWWARWPFPPWGYDPTASVYGSSCIPDNYWDDHQRIRQYTGGHTETWGGVLLTIDSNALDGEVTSLPVNSPRTAGEIQPVRLVREGPAIWDISLTGPGQGWVLAGRRLFSTEDNGQSWQDLTPGGVVPLGMKTLDDQTGWVAGIGQQGAEISIGRTDDGGRSWQFSPLPLADHDVEQVKAASIEVLDRDTLWIALPLASGSSFSQGLLFYSADGGATWDRRTAPLGEPVYFEDNDHGWAAGGPSGDLLYRTQDGGRTWRLSQEAAPDIVADLPDTARQLLKTDGFVAVDAFGDRYLWAVRQEGACAGDKVIPMGSAVEETTPFVCTQRSFLEASADAGRTWYALGLPGS